MKRILKWLGIVLGGLIVIVLIVGVVLHFVGKSRLNNAPRGSNKTGSSGNKRNGRCARRTSG